MIREKVKNVGPIVIDLTGPDGNAYNLLGLANRLTRMGFNNDDDLLERMMSGDYENLIQEFDKAFGDIVILER